MSKSIRVRAPLRLGLAGGGTDIPSFSDIHGGAVLNVTLNRYAYAMLDALNNNSIIFEALDKQIRVEKTTDGELNLDGNLDLHIAAYKFMMNNYNNGEFLPMHLSTFCEAPPGSGLGSSSTIVVAIVKALAESINQPLDDYEIANIAFKIEREDCGLRGGKQDQYAATFGGFNFMEFNKDKSVLVNPLRVKNWIKCELESSLVLFFTSISRESEKIIKDQERNVDDDSSKTLEAFSNIKQSAHDMKESILMGRFDVFAEQLRYGWQEKMKTADSVTNEKINNIYTSSIDAGAIGGKLSGAGGGGFMMLYVPTNKRMDVIRCLEAFDGKVSSCQFSDVGVQSWIL
ncbi:MAG: dehydrogenase [Gammaproteobacteria bacterium]|nr:dehydrogenase [Gammaproteobacteria bacterium]